MTVYAQLLDAAGNASALASDTIVVDSVAPTGTVTIARGAQATANGYTNSGTVSIGLAAPAEPNGGALQFKMANDNGAGLTSAGYQDLTGTVAWFLDTSSEGLKTVYAVFKDSAGNETASPVSGTITYDVTAPNGTMSAPGTTRTRPISLTISSSATDLAATPLTLSEFSNFSGATAQALSTPVAFTLANTGDGSRTVYARFRDRAGNDTIVSAQVTLDSTPPAAPSFSLTATGSNGATRFTRFGTSLAFSIAGADSLTGVTQMRLSTSPTLDVNGVLSSGTTSAYALSGTFAYAGTQGPVTVYAQLLDAAGNASTVTADTIVVDSIAPTGTVAIAQGAQATAAGFTNSPTVSISLASPAEPNGGALQFKIANDNGTGLTTAGFQDQTASLTWTLDTSVEGLRTVYVLFRDSAGNVTASPVTGSITYDVTPPTPATASISPAISKTAAINVNVSSAASDLSATEGLTLSESTGFSGTGTVGPMAFSAGNVAFTLAPGDGLRTVYARFKDKAGNVTVVPTTVTLDTRPPRGAISVLGTLDDGSPSAAVTASTSVTVHIDTPDAIEYYLGSAASLTSCPTSGYTALPPTFDVPYTVAGGSAGAREVRACLRDEAGNVYGGTVSGGWRPSAIIGYDDTPPSSCQFRLIYNTNPVTSATLDTKQLVLRISGCSETPAEFALATGAINCAAGAALPWEPFYSRDIPYSLQSEIDGTYTINACVRDAARNYAGPLAVTVTLDTQGPLAPGISVVSGYDYFDIPNTTFVRVPNATVEGVAVDATRWGLSVTVGSNTRVPAPDGGYALFADGGFVDYTNMPYGSTPATTSFLLGSETDGGKREVNGIFMDNAGHVSQVAHTYVVVDWTAPPAPRLYTVDFGNRGAHLFWDAVSDPSGILTYELWCGPTGATSKCAEVPGTQTDGWVLNLNNRKDQVFAVRAVDRAHNTSALGVALSGAVGFKRVAVPINSSYSVVPLDVATSGDNIFVTFSERDANWTLQTGNLKVASSNDRGVSWRIATLDSAFGVGRVTGKIGVTDRAVVVATVGSSDPPDDSDQGEVRVYSSTDNGLSWSQLNNASLASSANFGSPSGVGVVASGDRLGVIYRQWDSAAIRVAYSSTGGAPSSIALAGSAMFTPSASVSDIKSCSGNYSAVHAWRKGANLDFVTQYFINFNTADTVSGTALSQTSVMSNFSTFDIACVSLPEATQTYVVAATTAVSSGSSHYLYLRRKLVASANFSGTQNLVSDVDDSVAPRVWAGGRNVFILYRNAAAQLTLMESSDEGQSFPAVNRAHLETNPNNGYGAVMSGENTQDVAVAYTDNTGSTLTVLLPAVPAVRSALTAGDGLARLSWTPVAGVDRYQVASGIDGGFSDFNYSSVVTYDVLPSSPTALTSFSVRAVDSKDMPGNDGYIWQAEPASTVVVHTDAGWSTGGSASGGLVAYNQSALLLPPFGNKGVGSNDLRVYRTQNGGQTWTASDTTYSGNATTDARALAGFGGRATVFSKLASFSGIYYSNQMLAGGGGWSGQLPSSTFIPSSGVAFVAAKADPTNSRVLVAYTHRDAGYISTALGLAESDGGITYYAQPTFPIYNPSAYELKELEIVKFDGNRAVVAMREKYTADNYESVYVTDSITVDRWDGGTTWNTPTFVRGGYNNYVSPAPSSYDVVGSGTQLAGAGNSAYSVVAFSSNDNLLNRHSGNLYVSVTGTDVASSGFTTLALDHDKLDDSSISAFSNGDGHYITYTGDDVVSSQNRLKLAYCPFDCHLINSWRRSILSTVGTKYASKFTVAQTTAGNTPLYYVTYVTNAPGGGWELRVLRGGVHRLSR